MADAAIAEGTSCSRCVDILLVELWLGARAPPAAMLPAKVAQSECQPFANGRYPRAFPRQRRGLADDDHHFERRTCCRAGRPSRCVPEAASSHPRSSSRAPLTCSLCAPCPVARFDCVRAGLSAARPRRSSAPSAAQWRDAYRPRAACRGRERHQLVRSRGAAAIGRLSSVQAAVDSACQPSTRQRSVLATAWTKVHASSWKPCVGRVLRSEQSVSCDRTAALRSETRACVILSDCAADVPEKSTCRHEHGMRVRGRVMVIIGSKVLYRAPLSIVRG